MEKIPRITRYAHLVFTAEDLLNGNFVPVRSNYFGHIIPMDDFANVEKCVSIQHELMVCYSDSEDYSEDIIEKINKKMTDVYDTVLGEKSTFEI